MRRVSGGGGFVRLRASERWAGVQPAGIGPAQSCLVVPIATGAPWQVVEFAAYFGAKAAHNAGVEGSSPSLSTRSRRSLRLTPAARRRRPKAWRRSWTRTPRKPAGASRPNQSGYNAAPHAGGPCSGPPTAGGPATPRHEDEATMPAMGDEGRHLGDLRVELAEQQLLLGFIQRIGWTGAVPPLHEQLRGAIQPGQVSSGKTPHARRELQDSARDQQLLIPCADGQMPLCGTVTCERVIVDPMEREMTNEGFQLLQSDRQSERPLRAKYDCRVRSGAIAGGFQCSDTADARQCGRGE
jgi:hypothetical protein